MCVYLCVCSFWPVSDQPICGNQIVEEGEECDVGQNDADLCCFSAKQPVGVQCRLKPGKVCRYMTFIVYLFFLLQHTTFTWTVLMIHLFVCGFNINLSPPLCVRDVLIHQSESGPVLQSGLPVQAGGSDLRWGDRLSESELVFRRLAALPRAKRQGKPDSLQSGHARLH